MTITREQVADLREGDVVEITDDRWPGWSSRGPLWLDGKWLFLANLPVRDYTGQPARPGATLTVVSRVPRLYVNSDRTEPVDGDIIRDCDGDAWLYRNREWFVGSAEDEGPGGPEYFKPLTLLWDGTTGQAVTS